MTGATLRDGQADLPSERSTASYWHREPSEKLLGHRTTAELPATADVVIIGSGITGAFAAHFLKEANAASDVLMLEAREACWGATGRNGGHCQPSVYGLSTAVARFELNTYAFLRDLVAEHDVPCDWVSFPGTLGATTGIAEGELAATYEWTGIMGYSRDFLPWVGEVPKALGGDTGLWVAAGYTGHGMPRAALCAKAVVGMMNGQELEVAEAVGLPHEFLVSEERAAQAREMDNVTVADLKDMFV
ncbi:hypothetical protein VdG1_05593 [Verticillium dahliae VDG1]|nr:hypothetical protein VdG1_05593 [Verticillium dahliae VDG1]